MRYGKEGESGKHKTNQNPNNRNTRPDPGCEFVSGHKSLAGAPAGPALTVAPPPWCLLCFQPLAWGLKGA